MDVWGVPWLYTIKQAEEPRRLIQPARSRSFSPDQTRMMYINLLRRSAVVGVRHRWKQPGKIAEGMWEPETGPPTALIRIH